MAWSPPSPLLFSPSERIGFHSIEEKQGGLTALCVIASFIHKSATSVSRRGNNLSQCSCIYVRGHRDVRGLGEIVYFRQLAGNT